MIKFICSDFIPGQEKTRRRDWVPHLQGRHSKANPSQPIFSQDSFNKWKNYNTTAKYTQYNSCSISRDSFLVVLYLRYSTNLSVIYRINTIYPN